MERKEKTVPAYYLIRVTSSLEGSLGEGQVLDTAGQVTVQPDVIQLD